MKWLASVVAACLCIVQSSSEEPSTATRKEESTKDIAGI